MYERLRIAFLTCFAFAAGCDTAEPADSASITCTGACDGFASAPPVLEAIELNDMGQCWAQLDETTDPFFALHRIKCEFRVPTGVNVDRIYSDIRSADDGYQGGVFEGDELGDEFLLARLRSDDFPLTMRITIPMDFEGSDARTLYWGFETTIENLDALAALTEDAPLSVGPPIALWPVVLWPSVELAASWDHDVRGLYELTDYRFAITSAELAVGGPSPAEEVRYRRSDVLRPGEITAREIGSIVRMIPIPEMRFFVEPAFAEPPTMTITSFDAEAQEQTIELTRPGYYVIAPDGTATFTEPADLPRFAEEVVDAGAGDSGADDDGGASPVDAGLEDAGTNADGSMPADGGEPEPTGDPCMGACGIDEVCVGTACVERAEQSQSTNCNTPTASCDLGVDGLGEDADCAAGHACADGTCRRLTCQNQDSLCNTALDACEQDTDCDVGHACADGTCRRLSCQAQDTLCNSPRDACEESTDCAAGQACVDALCRRLSCQTQDRLCNSPRASCAFDTDCDSEHACVDNVCRRLSCQAQDTLCNSPRSPCGEDADCAADHVCAASVCRRLSCQSQDSLCNSARAPCETTSDCSDDHVCEGSLCKRIRCL